jgi:tetratricopeptide (TPR) repeat protein
MILKRSVIIFFGLAFILNKSCAQSLKHEFDELVAKKDTAGQRLLLQQWEKTNNSDPELFVAYANYYLLKSKTEVLALGPNPNGEDVLRIMDQDTSKKEPLAFIYGNTSFNPQLLSKGFDWLNRGIEKYPDRLDMRFGKVYLFGQTEDYENFAKEITKFIDYSIVNQNKWAWTGGKALDNPREFMLSTVQSYQYQLYNTQNAALLDNIRTISEATLKHYPNHVESLSTLSVVYILQKEYDKALKQLLRAERLNPTDHIVLGNIAQAYKLKEDATNAIKYYQLVIKHGDEPARKFAQEQIEMLQKK